MSKDISTVGKKVVDISQLVDVFEAQEGEIQHIIGKTGNGKTYEATRRVLESLKQGKVVYTTWQMILPDYYDEREDKQKLFWRLLFFKKRFYKFDYRKNWNYLDINRPDLVEYVAGLTDCEVYLDEGQDIFDSYEGTGMSKLKRKSLTRTRHLRKTLIIISQRAQAVAVTARANVTFYYKCVKTVAWWWPFIPYFKVYRTEEMDNNNLPIWEEPSTGWTAELWHSHFAKSEVYNSYNSWYLRAGIPKSQEIFFEAYELSSFEKFMLLLMPKRRRRIGPSEESLREVEERNRREYELFTTIEEKKKNKKSSISSIKPILNKGEKDIHISTELSTGPVKMRSLTVTHEVQ